MVDRLRTLVDAAAILAGAARPSSSQQTKDVSSLLDRRLVMTVERIGDEWNRDPTQSAEQNTADCSLFILERVQSLLDVDEMYPLIGSRDIAHLNTLIAISFKWGVNPRLTAAWSPISEDHESTSTLTAIIHRIFGLIFRKLLKASEPSTSAQGAVKSSVSQTHITKTLLSKHVTDILRPAVYLGWPARTATSFDESLDQVKNFTIRFLNFLPVSQAISSLGMIMSPHPAFPKPPPSQVKACSFILSRQLLRNGGVRGLLSSVFGEEDSEADTPLRKMEHVARVLNTAPSHVTKEVYFSSLITSLLNVIVDQPASGQTISSPTPSSHRRAASFTLSRLLVHPQANAANKSDENVENAGTRLVRSILVPKIHAPFLDIHNPDESSLQSESDKVWFPSQSLNLLTHLLLNADPSPPLISLLLSPIISPLYFLREYLSDHRPVLAGPSGSSGIGEVKNMCDGLLRIWGRVVDAGEVLEGFWDITRGWGGWGMNHSNVFSSQGTQQDEDEQKEWGVKDGELLVLRRKPAFASSNKLSSPLFLAESSDSSTIDDSEKTISTAESTAMLFLSPDPIQLVAFIKTFDRKDLGGALFVRCLDAYSTASSSQSKGFNGTEDDPRWTMLLLNLVLEMVEKMGSSVLSQTEHVLAFIAHSIAPPSSSRNKRKTLGSEKPGGTGLTMQDLRIVPDEDSDDEDIADSDDEDMGGDPRNDDPHEKSESDPMVFTSLNLLLSILEDDETLAPRTTPLLHVISSHLSHSWLTDSPHAFIRQPANEARLILAARSAASLANATPASKTAKSKDEQEEETRRKEKEVYQEALRLVQDPILPVRAHGLLMLRQLVVPPVTSSQEGDSRRSVDSALLPAILDVFMQSVQEDDSFVFLNAVQGLAAMVDAEGARSAHIVGEGNAPRDTRVGTGILKRLVEIYSKGVHEGVLDEGRKGGKGPKKGGMVKSEMDKRLRIGEALGQVVRRCEEALPLYVNTLVPPLLRIFRSTYVPTTLRSSALSILALCVETSPAALLPWSEEITSAMIDLLQLESVPLILTPRVRPPPSGSGNDDTKDDDDDDDDDKMTEEERQRKAQLQYEDSVPALSVSSKDPTLRRAALHFLALVLRGATVSSSFDTGLLLHSDGQGIIERLGTVVRYVGETDVDGLVRDMAAECVELLREVRRSVLG